MKTLTESLRLPKSEVSRIARWKKEIKEINTCVESERFLQEVAVAVEKLQILIWKSFF